MATPREWLSNKDLDRLANIRRTATAAVTDKFHYNEWADRELLWLCDLIAQARAARAQAAVETTMSNNSEHRLNPIALWKCKTCGCLWRDNLDGTVSLAGATQQSCDRCERLPTKQACVVTFVPLPLAPAADEGGR